MELESKTPVFRNNQVEVTDVKPERQQNRESIMRTKWWRYKRTNEAMRKAITPLSYYFTVPRVSKWAIFIPAPLNWLPGDKSVVVASEDFYILGILTSHIHHLELAAKEKRGEKVIGAETPVI